MGENKLTVAAGKKVFIFRFANFLNENEFKKINSDIVNGINNGVVVLEPDVIFVGCFEIGGGESENEDAKHEEKRNHGADHTFSVGGKGNGHHPGTCVNVPRPKRGKAKQWRDIKGGRT